MLNTGKSKASSVDQSAPVSKTVEKSTRNGSKSEATSASPGFGCTGIILTLLLIGSIGSAVYIYNFVDTDELQGNPYLFVIIPMFV